MKKLVLTAAFALPFSMATGVFAAGGDETAAPRKPNCKKSQVYDKKTKKCVAAEESSLQDDDRYETVRRLAHVGRYADAQAVLARMAQDDDRTLTYLGFTHRKQGDMTKAMGFYDQALAVNPANILARSYMGQGLVEQGLIKEAMAQLKSIRNHGGGGTWAEASLRKAIATGKTFSY